MIMNLTKSRNGKLLQKLLDQKLRVVVVFEEDYLKGIARIAFKDIQQDDYKYIIGNNVIFKGHEFLFDNFCTRHDCYFIVPNTWISVDDELPKKSKEYLVTNGVYFKVADFNTEGMYWDNEPFLGCRVGSQEVTHWMPIPAVEKGGIK